MFPVIIGRVNWGSNGCDRIATAGNGHIYRIIQVRVECAKVEVEQELTAAREDLEAERLLRLATAARERAQAILGRQAAEDRLRQAKEMRKTAGQPNTVPPAEPLLVTSQPRRRGRPPKDNRMIPGLVEWWTPGWKDRYR